jgi:acyl-CoA thioesterase FadM
MDAMNHVNNTTYFRYMEIGADRLVSLHRLHDGSRWARGR